MPKTSMAHKTSLPTLGVRRRNRLLLCFKILDWGKKAGRKGL